eukprot:4734009-Pyramimonas_sp.AAC.1
MSGPDGTNIGTDYSVCMAVLMDPITGKCAHALPQDCIDLFRVHCVHGCLLSCSTPLFVHLSTFTPASSLALALSPRPTPRDYLTPTPAPALRSTLALTLALPLALGVLLTITLAMVLILAPLSLLSSTVLTLAPLFI